MKYNFIKTDSIIDSIFELNSISKEDLDKEYSLEIQDDVFDNFKEKLEEYKNLRFLIVGDFDCDGICATTIIKKLLDYLNINNNYIIPSRIKQGYGINDEIVKMASDNKFNVLMLLDNGIAANSQIELAKSLNMKVMIIDHHEYETLPKADAIIHSSIVSDTYKDLSAGGLSLVLSLMYYEDDLSMALGGLSTLSDMMPTIGFNRFLIKKMMNILNKHNLYQLDLLNDNNYFSYEDLSFTVIPKINALSRMEPLGDANKLVKYLLADRNTCIETIEQINYVNEKRKMYMKTMSLEASSLVNGDDVVLIASDNFMEGLCGLVANRLVHENNKPIIVLSLKDGMYRGSGRSIDGFNLYDSLKKFDKYDTFGGHEGAIGLSIKEDDFLDFLKFVKSIKVTNEYLKDVLMIDQDILEYSLIEELDKLKPFGQGFRLPLIGIENKDYKKIIVSNRFPKYLIRDDFTAISFNNKLISSKPKYIIGNLKADTYRPKSLSLLIEDLI